MRRLTLLALLAVGLAALVLAACGSSGGGGRKAVDITFGTSGGNILPMHRVIRVNGDLSNAAVLALDRKVRAAFAAGLSSRQCPGTSPDFGSFYIRFEGRTVAVRGSCEPAFTRLWYRLVSAVSFRLG